MVETQVSARALPRIIQGGMGVAVSSWPLARAVAQSGELGVVSGTALDLVLARRLQDGDPEGHLRRAMAAFPVQAIVERAMGRYFKDGGRAEGEPYAPIPRLAIRQTRAAQELAVLGSFVEVWLAKEGHDGAVGINCLEKVQMATPGAVYGAMLAGVDAVLMGAGVPRELPRLLNALARGEGVHFPIDVVGAADGEHTVDFDPVAIMGGAFPVRRPAFLAIISAHVLAAYLAREEEIRPDGFVVERSVAGGHNAPPRRPEVDEAGEVVFGPRDEPDLDKVGAVGLPYWIAGASGTPEQFQAALDQGAHGIQVGTIFALSSDSGMLRPIREHLLAGVRDDTLKVRTDALASPTGFPFKVATVPGTMSEADVYAERPRLCDLGYLRTPFIKDDGVLAYRCASEPEQVFARRGVDLEQTVGRKCLCNGLAATVGLGQTRPDGYVEPPLVTLGSELEGARRLLEDHPDGWSAQQAVAWLRGS